MKNVDAYASRRLLCITKLRNVNNHDDRLHLNYNHIIRITNLHLKWHQKQYVFCSITVKVAMVVAAAATATAEAPTATVVRLAHSYNLSAISKVLCMLLYW